MIRLLLLAPLLLLLASCASLSEEACRAGDWEAVGFRDGAAGRSEAHVANHAEACAPVGVRPDLARWRAGRAQGLRLYCTPENAYRTGARGSRLNPVCPARLRLTLARAEAEGLHDHDRRREMARIADAIDRLDDEIDELREGRVTRRERRLIRAYRQDIEQGERRLRILALERGLYVGPF